MAGKRYECDILVIGAGPAGSSAAIAAAKNGLEVIMVEKKREVGSPIQCAEYIPAQLLREIDIEGDFIVQKILGMKTFLPGGEMAIDSSVGFIIKRDEFDQALADRAGELGVDLFLSTRAVQYKFGTVLMERGGEFFEIVPKVIIGADGPKSTVGNWMGSINTHFIHAVGFTMPLTAKKEHTEVYFSKDIPGGYGWLFPKGDHANVGAGVDLKFKVSPIKALRSLVKRLVSAGLIEDKIIKGTAGLIPTGGLIELARGNLLLAGDAAGTVHPITGAGISAAVLSGQMAGEYASLAVKEENMAQLKGYEDELKDYLFDSLSRAFKKKERLESYWQGDEGELAEALKWGWVGFSDYYKRERCEITNG